MKTVSNNCRVFRDWELQHRMLRDVSNPEPGVTLLDLDLDTPVMTAPIGAQTVVHGDAEVGSARGESAAGVIPVVSTAPVESA